LGLEAISHLYGLTKKSLQHAGGWHIV